MSWNDWTAPAQPWKVDSNETGNDLRDNDVALFDNDPNNSGKKRIRLRRVWATNCTYDESNEKLTGSFGGRNFTIKLIAGKLECELAAAPISSSGHEEEERVLTGVSWKAEAGSDTTPRGGKRPRRRPQRQQDPAQASM
jgi:hypothetical protein